MSGWCFSGVTGILPGWYFFHDLPDEPREVAVQLIPCFLWYSAEVYIIILFSSKMNLNILGPKRPNHLALISLISRTSFILTILLQNKLQLSPWSKGLSWETLTWCMQLLLQSSDESYGKAQLHELGKQPQLPRLKPVLLLPWAEGGLKLKQHIQLCPQICAHATSTQERMIPTSPHP